MFAANFWYTHRDNNIPKKCFPTEPQQSLLGPADTFSKVNETPLVVQWLSLSSNARDAGSIPGQGTRIPHAAKQLGSHRDY